MEPQLYDVNVSWTPDMTVGSPSLDDRNRGMFDVLAGAEEMISLATPAEIEQWLHEVMDRLEVLLTEEERELREIGYPELAFHEQLHARARARLAMTRNQLVKASGHVPLDQLARETCAELAVWLMRHVQDVDKLFFPYIDVRYRRA